MSFVPTMPGRKQLPAFERLMQRAQTLLGDTGTISFCRAAFDNDSVWVVEIVPQRGRVINSSYYKTIVEALEDAVSKLADQIRADSDYIRTLVGRLDNEGE